MNRLLLICSRLQWVRQRRIPILKLVWILDSSHCIACNEGKCCCLLCNFMEKPQNCAHLTTMIIGIRFILLLTRNNSNDERSDLSLSQRRLYGSCYLCSFSLPFLFIDLLEANSFLPHSHPIHLQVSVYSTSTWYSGSDRRGINVHRTSCSVCDSLFTHVLPSELKSMWWNHDPSEFCICYFSLF